MRLILHNLTVSLYDHLLYGSTSPPAASLIVVKLDDASRERRAPGERQCFVPQVFWTAGKKRRFTGMGHGGMLMEC